MNQILGENIGEVITNPNDNTKDVFTCKTVNKGGKNFVMVIANVDAVDLKKIHEIDPELVRKKWAMVSLTPEEAQNTNSEGMQKVVSLCQMVNDLKKYGNINPQEVINDAKFAADQTITPEIHQEYEKNDNEQWNEIVNKLSDPETMELLKSLHNFMPMEGLDKRYSERNIMRILAQDKYRQAHGKPPATYVAPPQFWRDMNRDIKRDAIPFDLWYMIKKDDPTEQQLDAGATKIYGDAKPNVLGSMTAKEKLRDFRKSGSRQRNMADALDIAGRKQSGINTGFGHGVYYDVADTVVRPGLEDKWNDIKREGLIDNIKWIPTDASLNKIASENGVSVQELMAQKVGYDDKYTMAVYQAIQKLCRMQVQAIVVDNNDTPNMEFIRRDVFDLITKYVAQYLIKGIARPESRLAKAKIVASMYVIEHHIAPEKITELVRGVDMDAFAEEVERVRFEYKVVYSQLCRNIESAINNNKQPTPQYRTAMEESVSYGNQGDDFCRFMLNLMDRLGIQDETMGDTKPLNITNENRQIAEAKFYNLLHRITNIKY